jgi:hypothetical protein
VGAIVFGVILTVLTRFALPDFFRRRREVFKPAQVAAETAPLART